MKEFLHILSLRETLTQEQAEQAMHLLMQGEAEPEHAAGLLMGLRTRGETLDELTGFTRVMREYAVHVECDDPHAIDLCGTGGDSRRVLARISPMRRMEGCGLDVCLGAGKTQLWTMRPFEPTRSSPVDSISSS